MKTHLNWTKNDENIQATKAIRTGFGDAAAWCPNYKDTNSEGSKQFF